MRQKNLFQEDDKVLARSIKNGNQLAFAAIFDKYNRQMFTLAYRYLKSKEGAEDAVQQVFINLWLKRDNVNEHLNIKSFLFTSLKNHTLNEIRNNRRNIEVAYESLMEASEIPEEFDNPEELAEMTNHIDKAVASLSPQRRKIYDLKISEGLSNQEIADRLGVSVNTVKVQYYHILKEIREYVSKNMASFAVLITCLFS